MRVCKTDIGENGTRQQVLRQGGGDGWEGGKEGVGAGGGEGELHGFSGNKCPLEVIQLKSKKQMFHLLLT